MTAVPLLSLDRRSPSPLSEVGEFFLPVSDSLVEVGGYELKVECRLAMGIDLMWFEV
jgi:hypothetical protein